MKRFLQILIIVFLGIAAIAAVPQDDKDRKQQQTEKSRWKIKKTAPVIVADLDSSALDLKTPDISASR